MNQWRRRWKRMNRQAIRLTSFNLMGEWINHGRSLSLLFGGGDGERCGREGGERGNSYILDGETFTYLSKEKSREKIILTDIIIWGKG